MYQVIKAYVSTHNGRIKAVWNVIDPRDGFIIDTFNLKRDALQWIKSAKLA